MFKPKIMPHLRRCAVSLEPVYTHLFTPVTPKASNQGARKVVWLLHTTNK